MRYAKWMLAASAICVLAGAAGCANIQTAVDQPAADQISAEQTSAQKETAGNGETAGSGTEPGEASGAENIAGSGNPAGDNGSADKKETRVTDGSGWYLWDENGKLNLEGREAEGKNAVVSSGKYEASKAGLEVLKAGGNAVDAAVAVSFALGVTEPNASGIGGGGFMTIRSENGDTIFVSFRETAPQSATPELWQLDAEGKVIGGQNAIGGKSVGVPGTVKGMEYVFKKYGSGNVSWEEILAPSIELAKEGFLVTPTLYSDMLSTYDVMLDYPEFGSVYLNEDGLNYQAGDVFKNPDLAKTLQTIAKDGADALYTGSLAQKIVKAANKYGGVLTAEDLAGYEVTVMEPAMGTYRGYQIISSPLPSSGGSHIIEALNILENFDISSIGAESPEQLHILTEAFKMSFHDREEFMGDPAYQEVPIGGILSKERAKALAAQIVPGVSANYEQISPWQYEHEDTTHFSVADAKGNMVAVTQTINGAFGSKVIPEGCGFPLNNEMNDFSTDPKSPNMIAGGKTPLSSMSPTIVLKEDGTPFMVLGSPGATKIITTVTQVISNVIDFDMGMQEAINAPRLYCGAAGSVLYESRMNPDSMEQLQKLGNELELSDEYNRTFGAVNGVMYGSDGMLQGGADPRRDGKALGY